MKKILFLIAGLLLVAIGIFIYLKSFALVRDRDGMVYRSCTMKVETTNSGSDEFGNSVGYGSKADVDYTVNKGDEFYESFGDELTQNPSKKEKEEAVGALFTIKSIDDERVVICYGEGGADSITREIEYDSTFNVSSLIEVMDGPNTSYNITFSK